MLAGLIPPALALALGLALAPVLAELCRALGYLDPPGRHKAHRRPTPLGGVIYVLPALLALAGDLRLFCAGLAVLAAGLAEDIRKTAGGEIPWPWRLLWFAVALASLWGLPLLFAHGTGAGLMALVLLAAAVISFNWLDHADGLCAAVGAGALLGLVLAQPQPALLQVATGALLAFLYWNLLRPGGALLFLGDAGAQTLGYAVVALALARGLPEPGSGPDLRLATAAAALPLLDALRVCLLRLLQGQPPWKPDRQRHLGHWGARLGLPRVLLPLACGALALALVYAAGNG